MTDDQAGEEREAYGLAIYTTAQGIIIYIFHISNPAAQIRMTEEVYISVHHPASVLDVYILGP